MKNVIGFVIKYKIFFIIILIIVLGFLLRLHNLTSKSIWYDEAKSIQFAENPLWKIISKPKSTPPLYFIILKFWIDVFGDSEFAVRFPSIIFGSASLLLIYWIGKIILKINKINILMPRPSNFKCIKKRYAPSHLLNKK